MKRKLKVKGKWLNTDIVSLVDDNIDLSEVRFSDYCYENQGTIPLVPAFEIEGGMTTLQFVNNLNEVFVKYDFICDDDSLCLDFARRINGISLLILNNENLLGLLHQWANVEYFKLLKIFYKALEGRFEALKMKDPLLFEMAEDCCSNEKYDDNKEYMYTVLAFYDDLVKSENMDFTMVEE